MNEAWRTCVLDMLAEIERGGARCQTYWAQQLAFAPVFAHAVALYLREVEVEGSRREALRGVVELALGGLAALPEAHGTSPADLARLAARQARALATGRRRRLQRLHEHVGSGAPLRHAEHVPERMVRPYPLLGWSPPRADRGRPGAMGTERA